MLLRPSKTLKSSRLTGEEAKPDELSQNTLKISAEGVCSSAWPRVDLSRSTLHCCVQRRQEETRSIDNCTKANFLLFDAFADVLIRLQALEHLFVM